MRSSVKSGAAATPTRAAARSGRANATSSIIQPPMLEPTRTCGPQRDLVEHGQRIVPPRAYGAVAERAAGFAVAGIVEAHEGTARMRRQ